MGGLCTILDAKHVGSTEEGGQPSWLSFVYDVRRTNMEGYAISESDMILFE